VREARRLLDRLAATVRAAAAEFMTEDARAAHQLVNEREAFRDLKATATRASRRFAGREGGGRRARPAAQAEAINGQLVAAAADPGLEGQGEVLSSWLRLDS
jgi:hypothetical protein